MFFIACQYCTEIFQSDKVPKEHILKYHRDIDSNIENKNKNRNRNINSKSKNINKDIKFMADSNNKIITSLLIQNPNNFKLKINSTENKNITNSFTLSKNNDWIKYKKNNKKSKLVHFRKYAFQNQYKNIFENEIKNSIIMQNKDKNKNDNEFVINRKKPNRKKLDKLRMNNLLKLNGAKIYTCPYCKYKDFPFMTPFIHHILKYHPEEDLNILNELKYEDVHKIICKLKIKKK
jgi:hypothetical protein